MLTESVAGLKHGRRRPLALVERQHGLRVPRFAAEESRDMLSSPEELEHRRLRHELEQSITAINRAQIGAVTGEVSKQAFIDVVKMVACLRARYLYTVIKLGRECHGECIPTAAALELKQLREAYTEAMEGFAALEHAMQRDYFSLAG
jgi:hypothetical protein